MNFIYDNFCMVGFWRKDEEIETNCGRFLSIQWNFDISEIIAEIECTRMDM